MYLVYIYLQNLLWNVKGLIINYVLCWKAFAMHHLSKFCFIFQQWVIYRGNVDFCGRVQWRAKTWARSTKWLPTEKITATLFIAYLPSPCNAQIWINMHMNKDLPDPVSLFESITDTWTDCFTTAYLFSKTQSKRAEACNLRTDNLRPICLPLSSLSLARYILLPKVCPKITRFKVKRDVREQILEWTGDFLYDKCRWMIAIGAWVY
jgi:hypothetical protein